MKKTIVILSIILVLLILLSGALYFGERWRQPESAAAPATSVPTTTEIVATEPSFTETPVTTEPAVTQTSPALVPRQDVILLNGEQVETYEIEGQVYIAAEIFAQCVGFTAEAGESFSMTGPLDQVTISEDGGSLTVNGETVTVTDGLLIYDEVRYVLFYELVEALAYPVYQDSQSGKVYITPGARPFAIMENVNVPILMYHAVSDDIWGIEKYFVSPSSMEEQLKYLVENGYDPIWFEDLAHLEDYDKPVILTFDDGYDDNYTELLPLLQKYGVKATAFVIAGSNDSNHKMTYEQVREMSASGLVSVQSHTYSHGYLDEMDEECLRMELSESQRIIADVTGKVPYVLCYPSGRYNELTVALGEEYYLFGLRAYGGMYNTSHAPFHINRFIIARDTDLETFASYISNAGSQ